MTRASEEVLMQLWTKGESVAACRYGLHRSTAVGREAAQVWTAHKNHSDHLVVLINLGTVCRYWCWGWGTVFFFRRGHMLSYEEARTFQMRESQMTSALQQRAEWTVALQPVVPKKAALRISIPKVFDSIKTSGLCFAKIIPQISSNF